MHYGSRNVTAELTDLVGELTCSVQQDVPRPPITVNDYLTNGRDIADSRVDDALERAGVTFLNAERRTRRIGPEFEGGTDFSGGEWQKLSIARLLLSDAPIWFLDEPASALDPESELELMNTLRHDLGPERIVVIVSHRLSTVLQADSYAMVSGGRIVEQGNPRSATERQDSALRRLFAAQITS